LKSNFTIPGIGLWKWGVWKRARARARRYDREFIRDDAANWGVAEFIRDDAATWGVADQNREGQVIVNQ
jgi:hypothetical protein